MRIFKIIFALCCICYYELMVLFFLFLLQAVARIIVSIQVSKNVLQKINSKAAILF